MSSNSFLNSALMSLFLAGTMALVMGCSGSQDTDEPVSFGTRGPQITTGRTTDGLIVHRFDSNGNERPDIIKYFEEKPDPDNPAITTRTLIKVEIDVNGDETFNIRRYYGEDGQMMREELDVDLDGKVDTINYFDSARLTRKELIDSATKKVRATQYYSRDKILRVEKDTSGNDVVDYWEFYEEGVLTRIGHDRTGDGRADSWQQR